MEAQQGQALSSDRKLEDKITNNCPKLAGWMRCPRVYVCVSVWIPFVSVITSAGGLASPLPLVHPQTPSPLQWKAGVWPWSGDRIELMCKNKWLHQQGLEGPQWQACLLIQPRAEHTVTWHLAGQANIHTYYTRIHGKTTAGAKGEDEKEWKQGGVQRSQRTKLFSFRPQQHVCLGCTSKKERVSPSEMHGFEEMFCLIGSDGSQYTPAGTCPWMTCATLILSPISGLPW